MQKTGTLLILLVLLLVLLGTSLLLGYVALLEREQARAWLLVAAGFLVVGCLAGLTARRVARHVPARLTALGIASLALAAYLVWLHPILVGALEGAEPGPLGRFLPLVWVALAALGGAMVSLIGAFGDRGGKNMMGVTDAEVLAFIEEHGLFVSDDEMRRMSTSAGPFKCPICRHEYTGAEVGDRNWKLRWVRCSRFEEHVYHAYDFERAGWRCPIDKSLMYTPKY